MDYKLKDIVHETDGHWVLRKGVGYYEVYRNTGTHSVLCSTIHFSTDPAYALERAIADCVRRDAAAVQKITSIPKTKGD